MFCSELNVKENFIKGIYIYIHTHTHIYINIWASLVAQTVKSLPVIQETGVRSLDWEDVLEKGMATHSSILAWRITLTKEPNVHWVAESDTNEPLTLSHMYRYR